MVHKTSDYIYNLQDGVEDLERYCKGGYHPVHIDDEIHSGRYWIVHKLGYGTYSTVWLALDQQHSRFVSLKILTSGASQESSESRVLQHLDLQGSNKGLSKYGARDSPRCPYVLTLLDDFEIQGPNGNHRCIITEVLGPSLSAIKYSSEVGQLPLKISRKVATQCAKGLAYLHACNIVHGDIHGGNVLFRIPNFDSWTVEQVYSCFGKPCKSTVTRIDGQPPSASAPKYTVFPPCSQILYQLCLTDACTIQIVDFGESFFSTCQNVPKTLNTPYEIAAPEILFEDTVGPAVDIWALACIIYEIFGNYQLFESFFGLQDEIMIEMVRSFGKLPGRWWNKWETRARYFHEDASFTEGFPYIMGERRTVDLKERVQTIVRTGFNGIAGDSLELEDIEVLEKVLRGMLRYEPVERVGAEEVLRLLPAAWEQGA